MQIILSPNDSVTAVMSGAAAATNPYYHATWQTPGSAPTQTTGSLAGITAVTVAAAPHSGQRTLNELIVYNADTAAVTTDITTLYVTCVASCDLEIRVLTDATP